jgi:inhibitor of cysteine peptidase
MRARSAAAAVLPLVSRRAFRLALPTAVYYRSVARLADHCEPRERKFAMRIERRLRGFRPACWVLVFAIAGVCGSAPATAQTSKIGDAANGTTLHLKMGDTLEVRLTSNPSTGYLWYLQPKSTALVKLDGQSQTEPEQPGVGRPIFQIFRFTARRAGRGDLRLHYVRSWEPPQDNEQQFTVHIEIE